MNSIKRFEKDKNKAVSQGKWKDAGDYSSYIGETYFELELYTECTINHQDALGYYEMVDHRLGMALANRKLGECHLTMGNLKKALDYVNKYLELAISLKCTVEEQRAWFTLGRILFTQSKNEDDKAEKLRKKSEEAYLRSLDVLEKSKSVLKASEYAQAKLRVMLNLGLIFEDYNLKKCAENIGIATMYARKYDLFEDLCRCQSILADVYQKHGKLELAVQLIDAAIETAERLRNNASICEYLTLKAQILIILNDFDGAKACYKRAYKVHHPSETQHEQINKVLKICSGLCICKAKLENLSANDYLERKQLFEKIADSLTYLEYLKPALHYYKKTLNILEEMNCKDEEKASIYYSIAETYYDLGDYEKAINYYQLELSCNENKPSDQVKTLWKIALTYENKHDINEQEQMLVRANSLAETVGNTTLIYNGLIKLSSYYETNKMLDKFETVKIKLENTHFDEVSSEDESDACGEIPFNDIKLSDSDDNEEEKSKLHPRRQRQSRKLINKKNYKGETALHKACIEGNFNYVKILVESGENVNAKDNAGWTPLHEACNHGHYFIVEYLLDNRANINDRGPEGITSLHDAASNGHLDIIQLLLSRGASVTILNDRGQAVLQTLLYWKQSNDINEETLKQCENIENQLKTKMVLAGQDVNVITKGNSTCHSSESCSSDLYLSNSVFKKQQSDKRLHSSSASSESDSSEMSDGYLRSTQNLDRKDSSEATSEYQNVMSNLRRSALTVNKTDSGPNIKAPPALIAEDEIVEDWLIKDTGNYQKVKKKRRKMSHLNVRKSKSLYNYLTTKDSVSPYNSDLDLGESETFDIENNNNDKSTSEDIHKIPNTTSNVEKSLDDSVSLSFCLRVRISDKLILVPVLEETATVACLAEAAAQRYYELVGTKPILKLTKDGAYLSNSDIIKSFFKNGEEVLSIIECYEEKSLEESYSQICRNKKIIPLTDIEKKLAACDKELNISNCLIPSDHLNMIFLALLKYKKLQHLNLSDTVLTDTHFDHIVSCFPVFENLVSLNLNCCCITYETIRKFSNYLTHQDNDVKKLPKLETVILSNNLLFSRSSDDLKVILQLPSLTTLNLSLCDLDSQFFDNSKFCHFLKTCEHLEELNVSENLLGCQGIVNYLDSLPTKNLKKLDLSYTVNENVDLGLHLSKFLSTGVCVLKEINLEGCHLTDTDLSVLSLSFWNCPILQKCNLSSNPQLTANALCSFMKAAFFENQLIDIYLTGTCLWDVENISCLMDALKSKTFKHVSLDNIAKDLQINLFKTWKEKWDEKAIYASLSSMFCELYIS